MKPTLFTENIEYMENYITEIAKTLNLEEFDDWCYMFVDIEEFFKHKDLYLYFKAAEQTNMQKEALICYKANINNTKEYDDFDTPEVIILGKIVFEGKMDELGCFTTEETTIELLDMRDIKNFEKMRLRLLF